MTDSPIHPVFLGPQQPRWLPKVWSDLVSAAAGGLLDESHWVDLKRELPAGNAKSNTELAKDLASFAPDGGTLIIGIEDRDSRAGTVCGFEIAKAADRVDQVAQARIQPPLTVRSTVIDDPDRPGWGCLLVHIPPTPYGAHMVDHIYYGRGDRANIRLSDEQVRHLWHERTQNRMNLTACLDQLVQSDPLTAGAEPGNGHIYLVARPVLPTPTLFLPLCSAPAVAKLVGDLTGLIAQRRADGPRFCPTICGPKQVVGTAEGAAIQVRDQADPSNETCYLDVEIREDGMITLLGGCGTYQSPNPHANNQPTKIVEAALVRGLCFEIISLTGLLASQHTAYLGAWEFGLRLTKLRGAVPLERITSPLSRYVGNEYTADDYTTLTTAALDEILDSPAHLTDRLAGKLLRGLGVADRYQ